METTEKTLYYQTIMEVLYKYMELKLSFDRGKEYSYITILPKLEIIFRKLIKEIEEETPKISNPSDTISYFEKLIQRKLNANIIEISNIKEGLKTRDIYNLTLAVYLKKSKNQIYEYLTKLLEIIPSYKVDSANFLSELIDMFINTSLSTSIESSIIKRQLMPYFAQSLSITYDEKATCKMYIYLMINLIAKINEVLKIFISEIGLTDTHIRDLFEQIDCFNKDKDESNGIYPIENITTAISYLKENLIKVSTILNAKNKEVNLNLNIKSET